MNISAEGPALRIIPEVRNFIADEATRSRDGLETGGILLGTDENTEIVIRHAGGPGPNARRETRRFLRDLVHAQQLAELAWKEDQSQWIGEWHTHPVGDLAPSSYDLESYSRHLHDPELGFGRFVAIIVGLSRTREVTSVAWIVDRNSARPKPITVAADEPEDATSPQPPAHNERKPFGRHHRSS